MAPVSGYFSLFVPLTPATANTFIVKASDTAGNTATGHLIITTSSSAAAHS